MAMHTHDGEDTSVEPDGGASLQLARIAAQTGDDLPAGGQDTKSDATEEDDVIDTSSVDVVGTTETRYEKHMQNTRCDDMMGMLAWVRKRDEYYAAHTARNAAWAAALAYRAVASLDIHINHHIDKAHAKKEKEFHYVYREHMENKAQLGAAAPPGRLAAARRTCERPAERRSFHTLVEYIGETSPKPVERRLRPYQSPPPIPRPTPFTTGPPPYAPPGRVSSTEAVVTPSGSIGSMAAAVTAAATAARREHELPVMMMTFDEETHSSLKWNVNKTPAEASPAFKQEYDLVVQLLSPTVDVAEEPMISTLPEILSNAEQDVSALRAMFLHSTTETC